MRPLSKILRCAGLLLAWTIAAQCRAQESPVSLKVIVSRAEPTNASAPAGKPGIPDNSNVAVWLAALDRDDANRLSPALSLKPPQLVQRQKTFEPHILIVPVGTRVEFPNKDPFFHNIFSLFDGKRFDLGLYEAGTARTILFNRAGVSFLFCNIHAEMSAVVVSVDTPYFGLSDRAGNINFGNLPNGRYQMNVWYERASPEFLKKLGRVVTITDSGRSLGSIWIKENPGRTPPHNNKYGQKYVPPAQHRVRSPVSRPCRFPQRSRIKVIFPARCRLQILNLFNLRIVYNSRTTR